VLMRPHKKVRRKNEKNIKGKILCKVDLIRLKTKYGRGGEQKFEKKCETVIKDVKMFMVGGLL